MAFDFTCFTTRQPKSMAFISSAPGGRSVTTLPSRPVEFFAGLGVDILHEQAAEYGADILHGLPGAGRRRASA